MEYNNLNEYTGDKKPTAMLVAVDTGEYDAEVSLAELRELAETAGLDTVASVMQKRQSPDPATCIGSGRLEEIKQFYENEPFDLLIFDRELSGSQIRNIENATGIETIDRTMLILDIFAARAKTSEGRLQVELAQQRYRLPRLIGKGNVLSRMGAGAGFTSRGPGETQLETDRRHVRRRVQKLEADLADLARRRELGRARRKKDGVTTVAIVGYTNVGKSTLLNALTEAGVLAEDKLFATLDPIARALALPDGRSVLLIDTVGLVRRLPHHLVEAFKSTLEEAANADLLLNVCDASSDEMAEQITVTRELFAELGVADTPLLTVLNKADLLAEPPHLPDVQSVAISAKTGEGLDRLLAAIAALLPESQIRAQLIIPFSEGSLLGTIRQQGKVFSEQYLPEGTLVDAFIDKKLLHLVEDYIVLGERDA